MKAIVALLSISLALAAQTTAQAKDQKPTTLKGILLEQLRTTHNQKDWFVPVDLAVEGLTPEQASWTDGKGNHSIGQLANHLLFWDTDQLARFKGEPPPKYSGDNNETFNNFNSKNWADTVHRLDEVLTEWEKAVENADDAKLKEWASAIAKVGAHNAYHTGQIIYLRKQQGWWDPEKGVK
ncbi:MAG TPA: DinB family protein [Terriglobales bacterium]|nr:DinB family protein [Terriglobales bacterium]